jgi:hypothetical protein
MWFEASPRPIVQEILSKKPITKKGWWSDSNVKSIYLAS